MTLDPSVGYTVEQLARTVGMSARNIRSHQARKLLPPPVRRGRLAFYDSGHVRRLEFIKALQRQGFNLVSIEAILGVRGTEPRNDALADMLARLATDQPSLIQALGRHGVVGWAEDGTVRLARPRAVRSALELRRAGLAPAPALRVLGEVLDTVRSNTQDLVHAVSTRVLALGGELSGARLDSWEDLDRYTVTLTEGIVNLLVESLQVVIENHAESVVDELVAQRADLELRLEPGETIDSG